MALTQPLMSVGQTIPVNAQPLTNPEENLPSGGLIPDVAMPQMDVSADQTMTNDVSGIMSNVQTADLTWEQEPIDESTERVSRRDDRSVQADSIPEDETKLDFIPEEPAPIPQNIVPNRVNNVDTSFIGANIRRTNTNYLDSLIDSQIVDNTTAQQARPIAQRNSFQDYFDVGVENVGGILKFNIGTYGGRAEKGLVGNISPISIDVNPQALRTGQKTLTNYVKNYNNLDSRGKAVGAFESFFDIIDPFFGKDNRPQFSLAGRNADVVRFGQEMADTFNVYANWNKIDDLDRFRGTARQVLDTASVLGFQNKGLQTGNASLGALNFGYSAHVMLDNWGKMDDAQRTFGMINTIASGASAYGGAAALFAGSGASGGILGAAGAGVDVLGVVSQMDKVISAGGAVSGGAAAGSAIGTATTYLGYAGALFAAYNLTQQWGQGSASGRVNGAMNGAAIGMAVGGPIGAAIGAALGVAVGSVKNGKSSEQAARDAYRTHYEKSGLFERLPNNNSHQLQLADGSFYDVGIDGSGSAAIYQGQKKTVYNENLIPERDRGRWQKNKEVRPYDVDYTSDLDYITSLSAKGLTAVLNGGSKFEVAEANQMNGYITNAATSNAASRDWNQDNFNTSMGNIRASYSKLGIENKEQALNYIEGLREDKLLSTDDYNAARLGIDFAFDENGFDRAQGFMGEIGRGSVDNMTAEEAAARKQADVRTQQAERKELTQEQKMLAKAEEERRRAIQEAFANV